MHDKGVLTWLHTGRRWATLAAVRGALAAGHWLGPERSRDLGRIAGQLAGLALPLRSRLATNLRQAGVPATESNLDRFFRRFGCWVGWSLAICQSGFENSGVMDRLTYDASMVHLERAQARGRGVILASPHGFCAELGAALVNRRHPVAVLARESKSPARDALKHRWYEAAGIEAIRRPRRSSLVADTLAYLRVLKSGRALCITPDVLVPAQKGVPVHMFGRAVSLSPGMIVLAMRSRAPLIYCWYDWVEDRSGRRDDCVRLRFDAPIEFSADGDREQTAREGLQDWCRRCESYLRQCPENWMFWLDKGWTRTLRASVN